MFTFAFFPLPNRFLSGAEEPVPGTRESFLSGAASRAKRSPALRDAGRRIPNTCPGDLGTCPSFSISASVVQ